MNLKDKKYIWVPTCLAIYFVAMAAVFGREMLQAGHVLRFCLIAGTEILVLVALVFALRKKNRLRVDRRKLHAETDKLIAEADAAEAEEAAVAPAENDAAAGDDAR